MHFYFFIFGKVDWKLNYSNNNFQCLGSFVYNYCFYFHDNELISQKTSYGCMCSKSTFSCEYFFFNLKIESDLKVLNPTHVQVNFKIYTQNQWLQQHYLHCKDKQQDGLWIPGILGQLPNFFKNNFKIIEVSLPQ